MVPGLFIYTPCFINSDKSRLLVQEADEFE